MDHTATDRLNSRSASGDGLQLPMVVLAVVVLLILVATLASRLAGFTPDSAPVAEVVAQRELGFRDLPGGAIEIYDRRSDALLQRLEAGEGSFVRGVVRSLVRQRRGLAASETGFLLTRHDDGRVLLSDPQTGEAIDLIAFGPANIGAFTPFLSGQGLDSPTSSAAPAVQ